MIQYRKKGSDSSARVNCIWSGKPYRRSSNASVDLTLFVLSFNQIFTSQVRDEHQKFGMLTETTTNKFRCTSHIDPGLKVLKTLKVPKSSFLHCYPLKDKDDDDNSSPLLIPSQIPSDLVEEAKSALLVLNQLNFDL